jgi:hypothetical protein
MRFPTTRRGFLKLWALPAVPCSAVLVFAAPFWVLVFGHAVVVSLLAGGLQTVADAEFENSVTQ